MITWIKSAVVILVGGVAIGAAADYMHDTDPAYVVFIKAPTQTIVSTTPAPPSMPYERAGFTK